jgi:hypothetical protein
MDFPLYPRSRMLNHARNQSKSQVSQQLGQTEPYQQIMVPRPSVPWQINLPGITYILLDF